MSKIFKFTLGLLLFTTLAYAFTPPTAPYDDPPDAYTVLQLSFDEADGSTTTDDESAGNHAMTNNGNVQTDSGVTKFSNTSLFDGTGDYWSALDSADWAWGTGTWTVDFWVRYTGTYQAGGFYEQFKDGNEFFAIYISAHALAVYLFNAGAEPDFYCYTADTMITSADTWYHVAVVRYGTGQNNLYIYLDGDSKSLSWYRNLTADYSMPDFAFPITIGYSQGQSGYWKGWMEEFRASKGIARDFITASGKQFIMITKFINNLNPDKIGTPMWSCKIKVMKWWKNFTWEFKA